MQKELKKKSMPYPQVINKTNVLLVNKDRLIQMSLYEMLSRRGYSVDLSTSVKDALTYINGDSRQIVITGSDRTGTELLEIIKKKEHPQQVIVLTPHGDIESATKSVEIGAFDYLVTPVEDEEIISTIERALANVPSSVKKQEDLPKKQENFNGIIGTSNQMKDIYSLIERISDTKATILLRGESGTGKRLVAQAIHQVDKKRKAKPFVEISCGALPREIIESELFGHTKGAFTGAIVDRKGRFELADGGTVLLDDIDSFSLDLQVKLLRVLQQKEFERVGEFKTIKVDVRIIVSTNQDLEKAIAEKKFREDLYYRLNVISITIPPLRERKQDLSQLIRHFVSMYSKENHKNIKDISQTAQNILNNYNWPGNVRELENIIERAVILDTDGIIDKDDLPDVIINRTEVFNHVNITSVDATYLKDVLKEPEKIHILKILKEVGGNKKKAAIKLGVNRTTLYNKLKRYNLLSYTK